MDAHLAEKLRQTVTACRDIDKQLEELRTQKSTAMREAVDAGLERKALRRVLSDMKLEDSGFDLAVTVADYKRELGLTPLEEAIEEAEARGNGAGSAAPRRARGRARTTVDAPASVQ
jgi:regulator of replication initiation timing